MTNYLRLIDTDTPGPRCDVTPLFADHVAFSTLVRDILACCADIAFDCVAGIDALGFILGTAVAQRARKGFLPIRKEGKLPVPADEVDFVDYTGQRKSLELRAGALHPGTRVLIVDEWVETGAQVSAAVRLVERQGGIVAGIATIQMDENPVTRALREEYPCCVASEIQTEKESLKPTIRQATKADFDPIGAVFAEENAFHTDLLPDRFQIAEPIMTHAWFDAILEDENQALLVAERREEIVGVLLAVIEASPNDPICRPRRYAYVAELAVAEGYRRQGIGRALMQAAERWAVSQGVNEIELNVWEANAGAITFYERLGYETIQRRMKRTLNQL
jgi:adenine phosphoribosyltransferase